VRRKILITCAVLFVFSQILFLINIQFPTNPNFDEFHYIPSAKQFLQLKPNQNWEHPPLAKELMAIGIGIWGDRPIGWRFMSTLFGSFTLLGMYLWAVALFRNQRIAVWVALITLLNQLLYVQARIGMLDTFMFAFIAWAMAAFTATWRPIGEELTLSEARRYLLVCGICLGLGNACKWFTVIPWVLCIGWVCLVRLFQYWKTRFDQPAEDDWYSPALWKGLKLRDWVLYLGIVPLAAYFVTFLPFLLIDSPDYGFFQIFTSMQYKMWDGQGRVVNSHPYMSTWTDWAMIKRPIWYAFDKEGAKNEFVRGVILLGNPWILWTGLIAIATCAWSWIQERKRDAFIIFTTFAAFYFSWAIIPRKVAFFYYYYPAGMVLSLALGFVFYHGERAFNLKVNWPRWAFFGVALAVFIYFFPISAALQIPADTFRKWMWRSSWI
jgi:dolichyl-phosphate-mannose--protein O-mannosyl transferase